MKKLILIFSLITLCSKSILIAQVSNYTFSQHPGTYTEISGDTIVAAASHTSIDPYQLNDVTYGPNHIPFAFPYNGVVYSNFMINSNGFITFGATSPGNSNYGPLSSSESYEGAVSAFGQNLIGVFGTTANTAISSFVLTNVANFRGVVVGRHITAATAIPADTYITAFDEGAGTITMSKAAAIPTVNLVIQISAGSIVRSTEGTAPFRVHTIQFKNFRQYLIIGINDNFNFQIKLFETTGEIQVVYGRMNEYTLGSLTGQVGLRGSVNTDFNNRTNLITLDWAVSTAGLSNAAIILLHSTLFPSAGTTYIWKPAQTRINVTVIPQGFYNQSTLKLNMRDTVFAFLRSMISPFAKIDSAKAVIDSVTFTGTFNFNIAASGTYFLEVKHRNSIETWSRTGVSLPYGGTVNYDFTDAASKAYGSNMISVNISPVKFAIFSGDVNQDAGVNLTDIILVYNDGLNFVTGYKVTDVTGDNQTDLSDLLITYNNSSDFVSRIIP